MYGDYTCLVHASPAQPPGRIPSCCWCGSEIQRPPGDYTALSWEKGRLSSAPRGAIPGVIWHCPLPWALVLHLKNTSLPH